MFRQAEVLGHDCEFDAQRQDVLRQQQRACCPDCMPNWLASPNRRPTSTWVPNRVREAYVAVTLAFGVSSARFGMTLTIPPILR